MSSATESPPLPPWPGRHLRFAGSTLFVRRTQPLEPAGRGSGQPAVFVHGLGGASTNWTDLMGLLAPRLDCYAPDLPGFGRSDPPVDGDYSIDAHVQAVRRLVESLDSAPVHLFGNSLGGVVSLRLAARYPHLVRSLTLVSPALPSYRKPSEFNPLLLLTAVPVVGAVARRWVPVPSAEERSRLLLELCYHDPSRIDPVRQREAVEEVARRDTLPWAGPALSGSLRGLVASYLATGAAQLWRQAGTVHAPVLLIWGEHDKLVPVALAERAQHSFPDARLVVFGDAGHVSQMEKPAETADAVTAFLDAVEAR